MSYSIEEIAETLKAARQSKQLSQRELSEKVGLTQSHISRIENAAVDLQVSNLIELARALELELVLVPKRVLPPVQSLVRESADLKKLITASATAEAKAARRLGRAAEQLQKIQPNLKVLRQIEKNAEQLRLFKLPDNSLEQLQKAAAQMDKFRKTWKGLELHTFDSDTLSAIRAIDKNLSRIRNSVAHFPTAPILSETRLEPAYQLTADDDDG